MLSDLQAAGMDDVLSKPADMMQMREKLAFFVTLSEPTTATQATSIDLHELDKISANATERGEILQDYLEQTHADIAELDAALQQQDFAAIKRVAHRIKGSSRMVGAQEMAVTCQSLEQSTEETNIETAKSLKTTLDAALVKVEKQTAGLLAQKDAT